MATSSTPQFLTLSRRLPGSDLGRLEKKCLVASACLHGFLVLLVLFGSAFFKARKQDPPLQLLNVVPGSLVDEALSGGGGNPKLPRTDEKIKGDTLKPVAAPPAPEPAPPKPVTKPEPKTEPKPEPAPRQEPPKPQTKATEPKAAKTPPKETAKPKPEEPPKPRIDLSELKPIKSADTEREREKEARRAREEAEARQAREAAAARAAARERARQAAALSDKLSRDLSSAISGLRQGFNSGTKVDVGGPGGAAFANYKLFVQMAYENAWVITPELTDQDFVALITVTIARDGRVIASRITRPSGSATMDRTVQRAMDRVRADGLPPFPEGATDAQRTFTIEFNLKAKSRLG